MRFHVSEQVYNFEPPNEVLQTRLQACREQYLEHAIILISGFCQWCLNYDFAYLEIQYVIYISIH